MHLGCLLICRLSNRLGFLCLIGCYLGLLFSFLLCSLKLFASSLGFRNQFSIIAIQGFQHVPGSGELLKRGCTQDNVQEIGVARTVHIASTIGKTLLVLFDLSGFLFDLLLSFVYTILGIDLLLMGSFIISGSLIKLALILIELLQGCLSLCLLIVGRRTGCRDGQSNGQNGSKSSVQSHLRLGSACLFCHMKGPPSTFALTLHMFETYP